MINSNLTHNLLNGAQVAIGAGTAVLVASGCTTTAADVLECSHSTINPAYSLIAIAVISAVKVGINVFRDGLSGLVKPQPPVGGTAGSPTTPAN